MEFNRKTIASLAQMICGDFDADKSVFKYRSSTRLTEFFEDCRTNHRHDGSTRRFWVADVLKQLLAEPQKGPNTPPAPFCAVIQVLMDQEDALPPISPR